MDALPFYVNSQDYLSLPHCSLYSVVICTVYMQLHSVSHVMQSCVFLPLSIHRYPHYTSAVTEQVKKSAGERVSKFSPQSPSEDILWSLSLIPFTIVHWALPKSS